MKWEDTFWKVCHVAALIFAVLALAYFIYSIPDIETLYQIYGE